MKVLHVPFCFYPDPVGGTEVYVEALAREQQRQGYDIVIAAPGERHESYTHDGLPVRRFGVPERITDLRDMYGEGDAGAAVAFGHILDDERPDLLHLHAFTRGASLSVVRQAKRRGIPVVFSYHTPTASCQRGTLLRWGTEVCEGVLNLHACARCTLHSKGLSKPVCVVVGSIPPSVGRILGSAGASGGAWTALRMTELVELRHSAFRALMAEVDHVVALCGWVKDLLLRNGVPGEKVTVSRQGLCHKRTRSGTPARDKEPLRVAFAGRLDPTKGVHILIQALAAIPAAPIRLDLYGVVQGEAGLEYVDRLRPTADGDGRINFREPFPADEVITRLQEYDVLAVPSQWLETGPMVILEAFAAGIPVLGSNLGGIAESIQDGVDGLLVESSSPAAWAHVLEALNADRGQLARLRAGVRSPRMIRDAAHEMLRLYSQLSRASECVQ